MSRRQSPARSGSHPMVRTPVQPVPPAAIQKAWESFGRGERSQAEALCRSILKSQAEHTGALTLLGIILAQSRRTEEAAQLLGRAAERQPKDASAQNNYGNVLRDLGRHVSALSAYERALVIQPDYPDAHYNRALVLQDLRRFEDAIVGYDRTLAFKPDYAAAHNNRGVALQELGRCEEAIASYDRALAIKPDYAAAYNNRGTALARLQRFEQALGSYEQALALLPAFADAHNNRGATLRELGRLEEAAASFERAVMGKPDHAEAHNNRGVALRELERLEEALASYDTAIKVKPDYAEAHNNRGVALRDLKRSGQALVSFAEALELKPEYPEALLNQGATLHDLRRFHEALACHERALAVKSDYADAYRNQALTLHEIGRRDEALASYERALALNPGSKFLHGICQHARMHLCDWTAFETTLADITFAIECSRPTITPFPALSLFDSPRLQRKVAAIWAQEECQPKRRLPPLRLHPPHEKVRIGYFSADFRNHAVSALAAELFEVHDRSRFELTAFSLGPDVRDELRERVERSFDRFIPLGGKSDEQVATLARSLEIDIAVDLGGYTQHARPRILALRAAPVQVSYLGFLGTMGGDFIDYLLADEMLVPREQRRHYTERIAYLPSYQANDTSRPISDKIFTRAELGLPASGFVFCCLNASYKINPETFASWMRILTAVPGSVLLLLADGTPVRLNLRREAAAAGLDPARLVFVGRVPYSDYLARYRIADLFLDTLPYNAGTTASDALWAGLPVLTCAGESLAARMGASLLTAVGLPELIAYDRPAYERLAIELAGEPGRLAEIRGRLTTTRETATLFDTPRLARSLEALYLRMHQRQRLGLLPEHLLLETPRLDRRAG
ncbi:MAG TPA: tetratricopeptide repeat protein [Steroidobacteraceae bacterium]|nr:tetratricopeptide repeat protein [Steroidobacteraceae bacterium]